MYSIRKKLNLTIIASMTLVLSLTAVFLYLRIADHVEQVFDSAVYDKAQAMISLTEQDGDEVEFDFIEEGLRLEFRGQPQPQLIMPRRISPKVEACGMRRVPGPRNPIAHLSALFTLEPGDLIYTGTPAGVGPVVAGDRINGGVDGVDTLTIDIV